MSIEKLIRPEVSHFEPYLPGRSIESVRRELGLKRVIKLASNENALGPSPRVGKVLARLAAEAFRYPDGASTELRHALARFYNVAVNRLIIGSGSDELIELLGKTFLNRGDSIVVSEHAFTRYRMAGELMGAEVITVPMRELCHDLPAMAAAVKEHTKIIFIANPNNPTGTYNSAKELEEFLDKLAVHNRSRSAPVLVVVDEAYYEYARVLAADYPDTLELQRRFDFLVVLRTFSKAHALAGLRVGYGFADRAIIEALDRVRPPFNVSLAGQRAATASLADKAHVRRSVSLVIQERRRVVPVVERMGFPVIPSVGNFFLMEVSPRRGPAVFEALLGRGIIVRSMEEYAFPQHVRVSYGRPAENQAFLKALSEVTKS